ncbi:MAG: DUF131 domain-containing protein [Thermoplasmata archaeon]|nr:MAG: DUF131 domain-containing protein [Thermoplasmata archaeon]
MNRYHILAVIFLICGIAAIGYSVVSGEGSAGVIVFIPVFYGSGLFSFLGVLCIMAAIFFGFFGFAQSAVGSEDLNGEHEPRTSQPYSQNQRAQPRVQKTVKGGGVVLIGPIPVVFGSDAKTAMILIILAIILIVAVAILFYSSWF